MAKYRFHYSKDDQIKKFEKIYEFENSFIQSRKENIGLIFNFLQYVDETLGYRIDDFFESKETQSYSLCNYKEYQKYPYYLRCRFIHSQIRTFLFEYEEK